MKLSLILCIGLAAAPALGASTPGGEPGAVRCDRLAAHPGDHTATAPPVAAEDLQPALVIAACREALAGPGAAPRHLFQLARGLLAGGETHEGIRALETAARYGHAAALHMLAGLHAEGRGVEQDKLLAYALYQAAFRIGHAPALDGMIAMLEDPASGVFDPAMAARAREMAAGARR